MTETIITARSGLSICHQTKIAKNAAIKMSLSPPVISLTPYFNENKKTIKTSAVPSARFRAPQPPPPSNIPKTAVPCVIAQMSQVKEWGLVLKEKTSLKYGKKAPVPIIAAIIVKIIFALTPYILPPAIHFVLRRLFTEVEPPLLLSVGD